MSRNFELEFKKKIVRIHLEEEKKLVKHWTRSTKNGHQRILIP